MVTVNQLYQSLEERIPSALSCSWDNDGLLCSISPEREVKRILCTLDVTKEAIAYAIAKGYDTILSHHPLIFKPLKAVAWTNPLTEKVMQAIQHDIAILSYHTRLDAVTGGVNDMFAAKLELQNPLPFGESGEEIGRIGFLAQECTLSAFTQKIKQVLACPMLTVADAGKKVKHIAIIGGDGKDFFQSAWKKNADTFVTGTLSYNLMMEAADYGMNAIEAGHFYTENFICDFFVAFVKKQFPLLEVKSFSCNKLQIL